MENISYVGLSHQTALKKQLDVTANNIANMSTPGFKGQEVLFNEYLITPNNDQKDELSMVMDYATFRDTQQGTLQQTGNPLDIALQGDGYFVIETDEDDNYTRAGNFSLNNEGEVVTQTGRIVKSSDGGAIIIPAGDTNISIDKKGFVSTRESGAIGQLKVVRFDSEQELLLMGNGLYASKTQEPLDADETQVIQNMLEGSNIQPITEMNSMIEVLRSYQSVQNMLQKDHERQRSTISRLTRVN